MLQYILNAQISLDHLLWETIGSGKSRDEISCKFLSWLIFPYPLLSCPVPSFSHNFFSNTLLLPQPRVKRWSYAPPVSISCLFGQSVHQVSPILYILNSKMYSVPTWLTESTCFSNLTYYSFSKITACHVFMHIRPNVLHQLCSQNYVSLEG